MDILVFHNLMLSKTNIFEKNMITLKLFTTLNEINCVDKIKTRDEKTAQTGNEISFVNAIL